MGDVPPLRFTVPGVQCKERPRFRSIGAFRVLTYTPPKTAAYEKVVAEVAASAIADCEWPLDAQYDVHMNVYWPDRRARDLSNACKTVEDGSNGILWKDDSQIHLLHLEGQVDRANPRVEVTVRVRPAESSPGREPKRREKSVSCY